MGGMDLWVSYPVPFKQMDDYINSRPDRLLGDLMDQFDDANPAFTPTHGSSFLGGQDQTHFNEHWLGAGGKAPLYWPYLLDIDIAGMLRCAFHTSVRLYATARQRLQPNPQTKYHATLWTCSQEVPQQYVGAGAPPMPLTEQVKAFRIAVVELDHVVLVLISTPEPLPEALTATYKELDVAYLIPHYRLMGIVRPRHDQPMPPDTTKVNDACAWIQYAHPMNKPYPIPDDERIRYGERPENPEPRLTIDGHQTVNREWEV